MIGPQHDTKYRFSFLPSSPFYRQPGFRLHDDVSVGRTGAPLDPMNLSGGVIPVPVLMGVEGVAGEPVRDAFYDPTEPASFGLASPFLGRRGFVRMPDHQQDCFLSAAAPAH